MGFLNRLKLVFGGLVAGIDVGMVLAGKTPVGLADVVGGRAALDAERAVVVFLIRTGHGISTFSRPPVRRVDPAWMLRKTRGCFARSPEPPGDVTASRLNELIVSRAGELRDGPAIRLR